MSFLKCTNPPPGWVCTREDGHDGPCAAHPEWRLWREHGHWKIAQRLFSSWAGAGYRFARSPRGFILRYFTKRGAQKVADMMNADITSYGYDQSPRIKFKKHK